MEKVIYALSRSNADTPQAFAQSLVNELGPKLMQCGVHKLSIAVRDADVSAADTLRIVNREPAIEAVVAVWLDSSNERVALENNLRESAGSVDGYLVCESEPLRDHEPTGGGERTPGMMQIAFLKVPPGMDKDEWFSIWRYDHTAVAIETQSTFVYRQNLVVRPLTPGAPPCAAIVEEAFPADAMSSQQAFYDAVGDDEKLERNRRRMWESSKRFVDVASINVVPTSEYVW